MNRAAFWEQISEAILREVVLRKLYKRTREGRKHLRLHGGSRSNLWRNLAQSNGREKPDFDTVRALYQCSGIGTLTDSDIGPRGD
jgi:ABC-type siderophore export system fused ATPase/permease subunit